MKHKFCLLYSWFVRTILIVAPDVPIIMRFRGWLYSIVMKECGRDFQVSSTTIIKNLENFSCGKNVYLAPFVVVNAVGLISLKNEVMIGFGSALISGNHTMINGSFRYGASSIKSIEIGTGAWIGANCTLVAGAVLPDSSLLAANSVYSKTDQDAFSIFGGVPANRIASVKNIIE
jgi:acetyltransferase-like isoleucine patch superfamily enzyme